MSSLCQICGACFYDDDLASNPLSHFCIGLDGPAIVHFETEEHQSSTPHTPEFEKPKNVSQPKALALPAQAHAQEDLDEIAKLHQEVDALKAKLQKGHVSFA